MLERTQRFEREYAAGGRGRARSSSQAARTALI